MSVFRALILGLVQGLTEFLPVSSSGHLVVVPEFLGWPEPTVAFDVLLHLGTLLAVCLYFWRELGKLAAAFVAPGRLSREEALSWRRLGLWIVLATIPAGLAGLFLEDFFASLFSNTLPVGVFFVLTATLLFVADFVAARTRHPRGVDSLRWSDSLIIGLFQALAIAPGLSRSGSTMSAGVYLGLDRESAARFSFLLSIPVILAAGLLQAKDLAGGVGSGELGAYVVGFAAAFASGLAAVWFLLRYVRSHRFRAFAIYDLVMGLVVIALSLL